ncbi:MAG: TIGR04086 family membrane protein [Methylocystaceae bacterium]
MSKLSYEVKGLGLAAILAASLASIAGITIYYTPLPETLTAPLSNVILVLSIFAGSGYVSYRRGNKGLMRGISFGMAFFILMLVLSLLMAKPVTMAVCLRDLAIAVATGLLGGILGVSLSS